MDSAHKVMIINCLDVDWRINCKDWEISSGGWGDPSGGRNQRTEIRDLLVRTSGYFHCASAEGNSLQPPAAGRMPPAVGQSLRHLALALLCFELRVGDSD